MNILPKLRLSADINIRSSVGYAVLQHMQEIPGAFPFKNCLNCAHFTEKDEMCNKYRSRPPAKVIAYGCPGHVDIDNLPF